MQRAAAGIRLGVGRSVLGVLPLTGQRQLWANHTWSLPFLLYKSEQCLSCLSLGTTVQWLTQALELEFI